MVSTPSVAKRFSRRHLLIGAGAVGAAAVGGLGLSQPWSGSAASRSGKSRGPLVLITLYGGNDGLNTVIPYSDPAYRTARPNLGYDPSEVLDLGGGVGLNPKLTGLHGLWKAGHLAIVRGVGYPNANLSHFASMAVWQTANVLDGTGSGWLGRWLDTAGDGPMRALSVGTTLPPVLRGARESASAITGPSITLPGSPGFLSAYASMQQMGTDRVGLSSAVASSGRNLLAVRQQLAGLLPMTAAGSGEPAASLTPKLPASDVAGALRIVADLIRAGSPTEVYHVSLESFDTHAAENANHERLLGDLDGAISQFFSSLRGSAHGQETVLLAYSEFGRRVAENASGGTDHGTASVLFIAGPPVKGGCFYGEAPSLTALDVNGNLRYTVDFRQVYATVLDRVLGMDPARILGGHFEQLGLI